MIFTKRVRVIALTAAMALSVLSAPGAAQEISAEHLRAARTAIDAINATDEFDAILPQAAQGLKGELIQQHPHMEELINKTVDEKAIELASRRADLEREAALAYARVFTQEELEQIAAFYNSEAGKKLLSSGPAVTREVFQAAEIWRRGVVRDLSSNVLDTVQQAVAADKPAAQESSQ
ncbi:DUF2059 domain-containing protein [Chelativorans sp. Marseille-P2723]|uniref:DUF2059 domain-containing protein n=1 Tax=Chelativorans sp. Marseille-P2723 TaxID=2709133 RepID=UPI00156ED185|nr:DUF2059 domain-containing protein [Chelativorans sp. Marseille-P2723]